mgnify:FL=1
MFHRIARGILVFALMLALVFTVTAMLPSSAAPADAPHGSVVGVSSTSELQAVDTTAFMSTDVSPTVDRATVTTFTNALSVAGWSILIAALLTVPWLLHLSQSNRSARFTPTRPTWRQILITWLGVAPRPVAQLRV